MSEELCLECARNLRFACSEGEWPERCPEHQAVAGNQHEREATGYRLGLQVEAVVEAAREELKGGAHRGACDPMAQYDGCERHVRAADRRAKQLRQALAAFDQCQERVAETREAWVEQLVVEHRNALAQVAEWKANALLQSNWRDEAWRERDRRQAQVAELIAEQKGREEQVAGSLARAGEALGRSMAEKSELRTRVAQLEKALRDIVDLEHQPGDWTQVAARKARAALDQRATHTVGVDVE